MVLRKKRQRKATPQQVIRELRAMFHQKTEQAMDLALRLVEADRRSAKLQAERDQLLIRCQQAAIQIARREGYIDRVHVVEDRKPLSAEPQLGTLTEQAIVQLRDRIANGTPEDATGILNIIDPSMLLDQICGRDPNVDYRDGEMTTRSEAGYTSGQLRTGWGS